MEKFNTVNIKVPYDNMINICDSKYDLLRSELVANGKETQPWIREDLKKNNPNVVVANKEHFHELSGQWGTNPCQKEEHYR
jgi:hypothetical protein